MGKQIKENRWREWRNKKTFRYSFIIGMEKSSAESQVIRGEREIVGKDVEENERHDSEGKKD